MNKILVVGSTSNAGRALVQQLTAQGEPVRAAMRDPSRTTPASGVERVRFDYSDPTTFLPALEGTDRVFFLGPPDAAPHHVMLPFFEVAARQPRKFVLMTAMGTEFDESGSLRRVELALERSGAPFVILRPNWFMDNFHTMWQAPIQQAGVLPLPAGDGRTSLIDARDIASAAAAALRTNRFDGRALTLTGPAALSFGEAAATVSTVTGKEVRYVSIDDAEFVSSAVTAGVPEDLARYLAILFGFIRQGATAEVSGAVLELTGNAPRSFEEYCQDHASAWA